MKLKKNRKERITEAVSLTLVSLNWLLFVASASNYSYFWWGDWLLYSRIGAACVGFLLAGYVWVSRTSPANLLTGYLTFSMAIQASHGTLEPTSQAEFYSYTGFFFLLAAMAYRGDFQGWLKRWLSVQGLLFLMPLWTKDRALVAPLRNFVDSFSTPTAALMLGVVMARINSAKHVVLQENLSLKESLLDEKQRLLDHEQRHHAKLATELEVLRGQIEVESRSRALTHVATQVAHDIRSPLMALRVFLSDGSAWKDDGKRQLCVNAIDRINGIAVHLLNANRAKDAESAGACAPEILATHIDLVIAEKRTQAPGCQFRWEIGTTPYGASARVNAVGFQRMLSNLLDNAIDATDGRGIIVVRLLDSADHYLLLVSDNGRGIPSHLLPRIGERGFTFGKAKGNGLGLANAKEQVEKWQGTLTVTSSEGAGAQVEIRLPKCAIPAWFASGLDIFPRSKVVLVDDDVSMHRLWQDRIGKAFVLESYDSPQSFAARPRSQQEDPTTLYLIDYIFQGSAVTGMDLIEQHHLARRSVLVTHQYQDQNLIAQCEKQGIALLPKPLIPTVPIRVASL